ncbi:MAG: hypothetical protein LBJ14_06385 [Desulfarculales bacterium]|nr:hypothetical protein [Desulfarculales bacterium]
MAESIPFVVKDIDRPEQARLLSSQAWPDGKGQEEIMFKLAYVRGLLDAWQIASLAPQAARQALRDLDGLNLQELAEAVDAYYRADPAHYALPPGSVILRIIAQYRDKEGINDHDRQN